MLLQVLRAIFVLCMAAVGYAFVQSSSSASLGGYAWLAEAIAVSVAVLFVCIDILSPRKKLAVFSGTFMGLIVGLTISYAMNYVVDMVFDQPLIAQHLTLPSRSLLEMLGYVHMLVGVVVTYLAISFILQTKDDFRFIIPYVEFSKQTRGARPFVLDTSVLIDGRVADVANTGILESRLVVPRFVLHELQMIADSSDKLKRNRGRRGLDVLQQLQNNNRLEVTLYEASGRDSDADVDERLINLADELGWRVVTNDFNLNKIASLRGVDVININDLANALKPVALPGEKMTVRLIKPGEEPGQGVGYLSDGTMVVVEQGRTRINEEVEFTVTSALQTSAGKMVFGRLTGEAIIRNKIGKSGETPAK